MRCLPARAGIYTAAAAARLAHDADVGELLLTHISGRYKTEEISFSGGTRLAARLAASSVTMPLLP